MPFKDMPRDLETSHYGVPWEPSHEHWGLWRTVSTHSSAASDECPELLVYGEKPQGSGGAVGCCLKAAESQVRVCADVNACC